jgi:hypothetical protein
MRIRNTDLEHLIYNNFAVRYGHLRRPRSKSVHDPDQKYVVWTVFVTLSGLQPLHFRPIQNATILKMKSDICKALQKRGKSDGFVTLNAQLYT